MRPFIALLLVLPCAFALLVENTNQYAKHPAMYGEIIVYEQDGMIHAYDISRNEDSELGSGTNPHIFGFTVAFETKESEDANGDGDSDDSVIAFANVRDKQIVKTKFVGHKPYVFANEIFFSTNEQEIGLDLNNDGDLTDDLIRSYNMKTSEVANTKAVGSEPVANQRYVVFLTKENQVDVDLNGDGDKSDTVIRSYNREDRQVTNIPTDGEQLSMSKEGMVAFISKGKVALFDARTSKVDRSDFSGSEPVISGDVVLFVHDGKLFGLDARTLSGAKLDVIADDVAVFEDELAFTSNEEKIGDVNGDHKNGIVLRYASIEDVDGDDVFDVLDNCMAVMNAGQEDSDANGVGDACEKEKKAAVKEVTSGVQNNTQSVNQSVVSSESQGLGWWWVLIILVLPFVLYFGGKFGYRYYRKRQKSFGF